MHDVLMLKARKALRALKGVVKIQALVRGFLVRKQAAATLRSMEALVRAQATVKFQRALRRIGNSAPARKSTVHTYFFGLTVTCFILCISNSAMKSIKYPI